MKPKTKKSIGIILLGIGILIILDILIYITPSQNLIENTTNTELRLSENQYQPIKEPIKKQEPIKDTEILVTTTLYGGILWNDCATFKAQNLKLSDVCESACGNANKNYHTYKCDKNKLYCYCKND